MALESIQLMKGRSQILMKFSKHRVLNICGKSRCELHYVERNKKNAPGK